MCEMTFRFRSFKQNPDQLRNIKVSSIVKSIHVGPTTAEADICTQSNQLIGKPEGSLRITWKSVKIFSNGYTIVFNVNTKYRYFQKLQYGKYFYNDLVINKQFSEQGCKKTQWSASSKYSTCFLLQYFF